LDNTVPSLYDKYAIHKEKEQSRFSTLQPNFIPTTTMNVSMDIREADDLPDILPNFQLFTKLLGFAHRLPSEQHAIRDLSTGSSATHLQLLNDALSLRSSVYKILDHETRSRLSNQDEVFFMLLAPPGYGYTVGLLTILALGGAVVPISQYVPLQEALYFAQKSTSRDLIYPPDFLKLAESMRAHVCGAKDSVFTSLDISQGLSRKALKANEIFISSNFSLDLNEAGLVIFTSGTSGPPKAVVLPREIICSGAKVIADHFEITHTDVALHCMPVHPIAGIVVCLIPFLLSGACLEFDRFDVSECERDGELMDYQSLGAW
jgi:malonyl-CoA/methylmalonyl-CoA synthetase